MDKEVTKTEAETICKNIDMDLPLILNTFSETEFVSLRKWFQNTHDYMIF